MFFSEDKLTLKIKQLLGTEEKLRIAVAFIGDGASQLIGKQATDVKIICNLKMGGTNPYEIRKLIQLFHANVKQIDNLHAKIYIGAKNAIVGSANFSANGLGNQPKALREAGYEFKIDQPSDEGSHDWFDHYLWGNAREITDQDLNDAEYKWKNRDHASNGDGKADSMEICDYNFDREDFPLITWYKHEVIGWSIANRLKDGKTQAQIEEFKSEIYCSVDIDCAEDEELLDKGRYIFEYYKVRGLAAKNNSDCFTLRSRGRIRSKAYHNDDETDIEKDVMLCDCNKNPPLFGLDNPSIYSEFRDLINKKKYRLLRDYGEGEFERCWFHPRISLMREFWKELQSILCKGKA